MTDPFSAPGGNGVKIADFNGQLLLLTPTGVREDIQTDYGVTSATEADIVVLDGTVDGEDVPFASETLVFQGVLQGQLKKALKQRSMVLGRLGQGKPSKPGHSAPWLLSDPTDDDKAVARRYLASKPKSDPFD